MIRIDHEALHGSLKGIRFALMSEWGAMGRHLCRAYRLFSSESCIAAQANNAVRSPTQESALVLCKAPETVQPARRVQQRSAERVNSTTQHATPLAAEQSVPHESSNLESLSSPKDAFSRAPTVLRGALASGTAPAGNKHAVRERSAREAHYKRWAHLWARQRRKARFSAHQSSPAAPQRPSDGQSQSSTAVKAAEQSNAELPALQHLPATFKPSLMSLKTAYVRKVGLAQWQFVPLRSMLVDDYMFALESLVPGSKMADSRWIIPQMSAREASFALLLCFQRLILNSSDPEAAAAAKSVSWLRRITAMDPRITLRSSAEGSEVTKKAIKRAFRRMQAVNGPRKPHEEALLLAETSRSFLRSPVRMVGYNEPLIESLDSIDEVLNIRQLWKVRRMSEQNRTFEKVAKFDPRLNEVSSFFFRGVVVLDWPASQRVEVVQNIPVFCGLFFIPPTFRRVDRCRTYCEEYCDTRDGQSYPGT